MTQAKSKAGNQERKEVRVRICYTVDVSEEYRRAVRRYYGETGMATREEIQNWHQMHGAGMDDDVIFECGDKAENTTTKPQ